MAINAMTAPDSYKAYMANKGSDVSFRIYYDQNKKMGANWQDNWTMLQRDVQNKVPQAIKFHEDYLLWLLTR